LNVLKINPFASQTEHFVPDAYQIRSVPFYFVQIFLDFLEQGERDKRRVIPPMQLTLVTNEAGVKWVVCRTVQGCIRQLRGENWGTWNYEKS
jgi:hypothetical protein